MSVINQMLRDLDQRTMPADRAIYASRFARNSSRYVTWRRWAGAGVVIVGGIAVSVAIANWGDSSNGAIALITESSAAVIDVGATRPGAPNAIVDAVAIPTLASPAVTHTPVAAPSDPDAMPAARKSSNTADKPERAEAPNGRVGLTEPNDEPVVAPITVAALDHPHFAPPLLPSIATAALPRLESPDVSALQIEQRIIRKEAPRSADSEFRRAAVLIDQGRIREAQDRLRDALDLDARHEAARQTLAALLLEERSYDAAEAVLAAGLRSNPAQTNFALALSRLNLERGNMPAALAVLHNHAAYAVGHAEYRAFAAALYAKSGAHADAIVEYEAALRLAPRTGPWWIGLGLANEAEDRTEAATDAYRNARATGSLSASLSEFVERKLQRKQ